MADTIRTKAKILQLLADNKSNNISPQDMRDAIVTIYNDMSTAGLLGPYLYIAFALDANGSGLTTTPNAGYDYVAFKNSPNEILSLQQSDFNGLWIKYKNMTPIIGSNVYIAYADDAFGLNFTTTFDPSKEWIGIIASPTPLTPLVGDFSGLWKNYTGNSEFGLATPTFSRNRNFVTNQFLRDEDGSPSNLSPYVLPWNATLKAISMSCDGLMLQTSGTLIIGAQYKITNYVIGDDFTNVGGINLTGNIFIATGTTPAIYSNSSILERFWSAEIYINGTLLPLGDLQILASNKNYNNLFSIDLNANDAVSVYMDGIGVNRPKTNLVFRRR